MHMNPQGTPLPAVARSSAQERETPRHELTIKDASSLFAEFGVPRSPRSVQGFCKDGHIDCVRIKGPTGDKYFVDRTSVERYAKELKQIEEIGKISSEEFVEERVDLARNSAQQREAARESVQERAVVVQEPHEEPTLEDRRVRELEDSVKNLKEENLNLKVDNKGKEFFINQLVGEREKMLDKVQEISYKLGFVESRLHQLEAPKDEARNSAQDREEARGEEISESNIPNQHGQEVVVVETTLMDFENKNSDVSSTAIVGRPTSSIWKKIFR